MHSIVRHSRLNADLAPAERLMQKVPARVFDHQFIEEFQRLELPRLKAVHSHVFPWFIHWCEQHRRKTGVRWVHTHHNWYYPEFAREELEPWQIEFNEGFKFALENADVGLVVSKSQQKFLRESFDLKSTYLPNGVDVALCDEGNPARCRKQTGLNNFILYAGRNDPVKNPADFVRLAQRLPNHQFLMVGQGLSNAVMQTEWNVAVPKNLKIQGEATPLEIQDAIAACLALVVTSKREGLPTLVMESMAHSKPTIVPEEEGCMEVIGHGDFGFIYRQGDIDHLAEITLEAIADTARCGRARQRVLDEYNWPVVSKKLDEIYTTGQMNSHV